MFNLGFNELIVILIIILLLFGPKRLTEIARALGKAVKEFRNPHDEPGNDREKVNPEIPDDDPRQ